MPITIVSRPREGGRLHGGDSEKMILAIALLPPFKTPFSFSWISSPSPTSLSAAVRNINQTTPQKIKKKCGEIQSLHCEKALTITNLSKRPKTQKIAFTKCGHHLQWLAAKRKSQGEIPWLLSVHCGLIALLSNERLDIRDDFMSQSVSLCRRVSLAVDANDGFSVGLAQMGPTVSKINLDTVYS